MRGELSSAKFAKRHPLDWYVEQGWEWQQIATAIGLDPEREAGTIWDPAAGFGHSGSWLQGIAGFDGEIVLSDVADNVAWADFDHPELVQFFSADFLDDAKLAPPVPCSIWCNPPYSYLKVGGVSIAQLFARQALRLATHRVVVLVPLKWLAGGERGRFFREFPPERILYFTTRPSMPPGDRIHLMAGRAYSGGMVDYCAVVWDVRNPTAPGETRSVWLPRLGAR